MFFQWLAINREAVATRTYSRFFGVEGGEALFFPREPKTGTVWGVASPSEARVFCWPLVHIAAPLGGGLFDNQQ